LERYEISGKTERQVVDPLPSLGGHRRAPANPRIRHEKIAMRICDGLGESRVHAFEEPKQ
jgi:hypothetical protein